MSNKPGKVYTGETDYPTTLQLQLDAKLLVPRVTNHGLTVQSLCWQCVPRTETANATDTKCYMAGGKFSIENIFHEY